MVAHKNLIQSLRPTFPLWEGRGALSFLEETLFTLTYHPGDRRPYWIQRGRVILAEVEDYSDAGVMILNCAHLSAGRTAATRPEAWDVVAEVKARVESSADGEILLRDRPADDPRLVVMQY